METDGNPETEAEHCCCKCPCELHDDSDQDSSRDGSTSDSTISISDSDRDSSRDSSASESTNDISNAKEAEDENVKECFISKCTSFGCAISEKNNKWDKFRCMNPTCNKAVQGPNTNPERNSTSRRLFCNQKCENDFEKMGGKMILSDEGVPEYMYQPCMWVE